MKMKIVDNAIDSLNMSLAYFSASFDPAKKKNRLIKLTIIFLHNALELLLKSILINHDELIIYKDLDKRILEEARQIQNQDKNNYLCLDEILIKQKNIRTISYAKLISIYTKRFSCNQKTEIILKRLGDYRNSITHFGIDEDENLDDLFIILFESFYIILNVIYPELLEIHEYFSFNDVIDQIDEWFDVGNDFLRELCVKNLKKKINIFTSIFKDVLSSTMFQTFCFKNHISLNVHFLNYDEDEFWIELYQNGNYVLGLFSEYSPFHNATIFQEENGTIYFIVEHDENKIYVYNSHETYRWEPEEYKRWEEDIKKDLCEMKELNTDNLLMSIQGLILQELTSLD